MKASELLRRYAAGERDFRGVSLRGQSLKGQDLSGADFSGADIRSADFTGAVLCGANFSGAVAGLQKRWAIGLVLVSWVLAGISGILSVTASLLMESIRTITLGDTIPDWIPWLVIIFSLVVFVNREASRDVVAFVVAVIFAVSAALVVLLAFVAAKTVMSASVGAVVVVGTIAGSSVLTEMISFISSVVVAGMGMLVFVHAVAFAVEVSGVAAGVTVGVAAGVTLGVVAEAVALVSTVAGMDTDTATVTVTIVDMGIEKVLTAAVFFSIFSAYIGWRSLEEYFFISLRSQCIDFAAIGGTSFRNANLTQATFTQAMLKSTDLRKATLTLTNWHQTQKLDRARVGESILLNPKVRELVVTHRGKGQSYKRADLRGANLTGADLSDADLTETDIGNATLEGAWLERANLTKAQALGTNFHQAQLTGACLEAWNIDSTTRLEDAICEYVYLLDGQKERQPSSGDFEPGEFAKLFEEVLDTIGLIFRNGVDWKAFVTSFKQVQVENEGVELSIKSIENKGDGVVVVRVNAPPEADKEKIHSDFNRNYEAELEALKAEYQAQLQAKDEQIITIYREKSADMMEITKLLANRPITHAPTHINQVDAMTHQHPGGITQNISSSPNSNINAFQGNQNQVTQTQSAQAQPSQEEVIEMLAQIKSLIEAAALPGEVKIAANANLQVAQKAVAQEEPKKEIALATLESMAETLEEASKTVEAGKTLWGQVKPILVKVAGWLGAAAGSLLLG